jgi:hypothetical protein
VIPGNLETAVALQGTLDTFALPDVLRLLSSTRKSGRLAVTTERGDGVVWLVDGELTTTRFGDGDLPPVDVLFELLRSDGGSFEFDTDQPDTHGGEAQGLESVLAEAEQMLAQWNDVVAVIPSVHSQLTLASEIDADSVTIDREDWRRLAAIGAASTTRELQAQLGLGELSAALAVKGLVEAGLVCVGDEVVPVDEAEGDEDAGVVEDVEEAGDGPDLAATDPWGVGADTEDQPADELDASPAEEELASTAPRGSEEWDAEPAPDAVEVAQDAVALSDLPEPLPGSEPLDRFAVFDDGRATAPAAVAHEVEPEAPRSGDALFGQPPAPTGASNGYAHLEYAVPPPPPPPPPLPERRDTGADAAAPALPADLDALSDDAARAVAAVITGDEDAEPSTGSEAAQDTAEHDSTEPGNRGLLLRLLGPNRS